jgi:hypothetical protein
MGVIGGDFGFTVGVADPDKDDFMVHVFWLTLCFNSKIIPVQIDGFIRVWR